MIFLEHLFYLEKLLLLNLVFEDNGELINIMANFLENNNKIPISSYNNFFCTRILNHLALRIYEIGQILSFNEE